MISLDRSLILVSAVRGFSGGKLVALDGTALLRLEVEDLASLAREGLELLRFDLLADLWLESLSNTLFPVTDIEGVEPVLGSVFDFDNLSMMEFFLAVGFLRSFSE